MIRDRLFDVINHSMTKKGANTLLAKESGIAATSWQNASSGKQRATEEMIEFVSRKWPEYAYWIVTGENPENSKHTTPRVEKLKNTVINFSELLKKEPLDLTDDQAEILKLQRNGRSIDEITRIAIDYALEARDKGWLITKYLKQKEEAIWDRQKYKAEAAKEISSLSVEEYEKRYGEIDEEESEYIVEIRALDEVAAKYGKVLTPSKNEHQKN
jgi:hypothetical protein